MSTDPTLCSICFMEPEEGSAVTRCSHQHHTLCCDCAHSFLLSSLTSVTQPMLRQWKESKTLPCPLSTAAAGGDTTSAESAPPCVLTSRDLFALKDAEVSSVMCDLSASLSSTIAQQEVMDRMITASDNGPAPDGTSSASSSSSSSETTRLVAHITGVIDDLCTGCIACPHCSAPFVDFSGCMALTCGACNKEFCGVCLVKKHRGGVADAHAQVLQCLEKYDDAFLASYGMSKGNYFISNSEGTNWERWKDRIKASRLLEYLFTIKKDVLWRVYDAVEAHIVKNALMNEGEIGQLNAKVFSHEANAQHLVRLPVLFWLLYASKKDCSFQQAMAAGEPLMTQTAKIELGRLCVQRMREVYPS